MTIEAWDEIRTAYQVARLGTVSAAAEVLGVHHATVIRHVSALESRLGVRLFQRHARGYTPTEAGRDLLQVAQGTEEQLNQFAARVRGRGQSVSGELIVTSLAELAPLLTPALIAFQQRHPALTARLLTDPRLFRLEFGEAHVAIRAGTAPQEPDNVVQPFVRACYALYATPAYLERRGRPQDDAALAGHHFAGIDGTELRAPFDRWLAANVPSEAIRFRSRDRAVLAEAVRGGAGLGFLPVWQARNLPDLVEVMGPRAEWASELWLVTHVDLHRTTKVQQFVRFLKEQAAAWPME